DCLLAGQVDAWLAGRDPESMLRHAIGCALANAKVWDAGAVGPDQVLELSQQVVIEPAPSA
ncbi:1-phosphofructokinase family hexose kinase, partial [Singulisphaera rosea]